MSKHWTYIRNKLGIMFQWNVRLITQTQDIFSLADVTRKHPKYPFFCIMPLEFKVNIDIHKHENSEGICLGTPDCKNMENIIIDFIWLNVQAKYLIQTILYHFKWDRVGWGKAPPLSVFTFLNMKYWTKSGDILCSGDICCDLSTPQKQIHCDLNYLRYLQFFIFYILAFLPHGWGKMPLGGRLAPYAGASCPHIQGRFAPANYISTNGCNYFQALCTAASMTYQA